MPSITKKNTNDISVVKKMRDYSNDPFFKEKAKSATEFLKKNGLSKFFEKKKK